MSEVAFFDPSTPNLQSLISRLNPQCDYYILDRNSDGVAQVAQILSSYSGLDAIHIFCQSWGSEIGLGNSYLYQYNLTDFQASLAAIGSSLSETGDILLYAGDVGAGEGGAAFLSALADATGADIAAPTMPYSGGSWQLDATTGPIEATPLVPANSAPMIQTAGTVTTSISQEHDGAESVVLQKDGKIVIVGSGDNDFEVVRYNADGSLDTSFNSSGVATANVWGGGRCVALQPDGKIIAAGNYSSQDDGSFGFGLVRYNPDGSLDTSFGTNGIATTDVLPDSEDEPHSIAMQADGKIVVAGGYDRAALVRYNADGSLDTDFGNNGVVVSDYGLGPDSYDRGASVVIQPDGKILLSGTGFDGEQSGLTVTRYNSDGTLDTAFGSDGAVFTPSTYALGGHMTLQPDGKILVEGTADRAFTLVRYNADGSLDSGFGTGGEVMTLVGDSSYGDEGYGVTLQSDGKILITGQAENGSSWDFTVVRYNADGSLDTGFGSGGKVMTAIGPRGLDEAYSIVVQPDGKIVVAGSSQAWSTTEAGLAYPMYKYDIALVRYNPDGTLDTEFGSSASYLPGSAAVALDPNVLIFDNELAAANWDGCYAGASLTLSRDGGPSAEDVFSNSGTLGALEQGGDLVVNGVVIGTVATNGGGTLVLAFNADATSGLVNAAARQIAYSNSSATPPASVHMDWTFNDGNQGGQGTGGALSAMAVSTVHIGSTTTSDPAIYGTEGNDVLYGNDSVDDVIYGKGGDDILYGLGGNDQISGGDGHDTLDGGSGADTLIGGAGDDVYHVDNGGDIVVEGANGGTDTVISSVTYTLSENVENLTLSGTASINGTGNALDNVLTGNSVDNVLTGGAGADTFIGGAGNDTLVGGTGNDVYEFGPGFGQDNITDQDATAGNLDIIRFTGGIKTSDVLLFRDASNLYLALKGSSDVLTVNNWFVDPSYRVEKVEFADGSWDSSVLASASMAVASTSGSASAHGSGNAVILGQSTSDTLTGQSGNDTLYGQGGNDTLNGSAGNDYLSGGEGNDSLLGGIGQDTLNGGAGNDIVNGGMDNDIYQFGRGDGQDLLIDFDPRPGNTDVINFGPGIDPNQLWFQHVGNDLVVSIIGASDSITIQDWYSGSAHHVEQFHTADNKVLLDTHVDNLVQAMSTFAAPAVGQTTLLQDYQSALSLALATAWI